MPFNMIIVGNLWISGINSEHGWVFQYIFKIKFTVLDPEVTIQKAIVCIDSAMIAQHFFNFLKPTAYIQ